MTSAPTDAETSRRRASISAAAPLRAGCRAADSVAEWIRGHNEDDLPAVRQTPGAAWKWMIDEWSMQLELATARMRIPDGPFRQRLRSELAEARSLYAERGWLTDPAAYHRTPPPLDSGVQARATSAGDADFWHVRFNSEFEPWPGEPGRDRWMSYRPVRTTHAWMLQHPDRPRPWVVAVNGYRTGEPETDMWMLYANRLHRRWGLNVIAVVLPLHGPRAIGMSGSRVIHAGAMNTVFTVAQGAWDIRRVIGWVRDQHEAPAVAVSGISLGGYMAAMTAALDDNLAAVIAGVPESDLARGTRRQVEPLLPPFYEQWGLSWEPLRADPLGGVAAVAAVQGSPGSALHLRRSARPLGPARQRQDALGALGTPRHALVPRLAPVVPLRARGHSLRGPRRHRDLRPTAGSPSSLIAPASTGRTGPAPPGGGAQPCRWSSWARRLRNEHHGGP